MTVFVFKLEKGAINSGKGAVYFEMSYKTERHEPLFLNRLMKEHPVTVEYKAKGYVGPVAEATYVKDWKEELSKIDDVIVEREKHRDGFPAQYYDALKMKKNLLRAKELYEANLVILEN